MVLCNFARNLINKMAEEKKLSEELLRYGEIKADYQIGRINDFQRIRVIRLEDKVYVHYMVDGEFVACYEV